MCVTNIVWHTLVILRRRHPIWPFYCDVNSVHYRFKQYLMYETHFNIPVQNVHKSTLMIWNQLYVQINVVYLVTLIQTAGDFQAKCTCNIEHLVWHPHSGPWCGAQAMGLGCAVSLFPHWPGRLVACYERGACVLSLWSVLKSTLWSEPTDRPVSLESCLRFTDSI